MPNIGPLQGKPRFYRGASMDDLKKAERVRMLLFGDEPDGSKVIYDCVAKYKGEEAGPIGEGASADF